MSIAGKPRTIFPTAAVLAVSAGLALALTACDGRDATSQAVYQAEVEFTGVVGGPASEAEYAERVYKAIESSLQPRAGKGPQGAGEAASVLLATAQHGLAATAVESAARYEHEVRSRLRVMMGQVSEWSRLNALAEAAATYDPRPELADIDESLAATRRYLAEFEELQRDAQARVADLTAQVEDLRGRSLALRNEAGDLRLEMSRSTSARASELAPRVRELMDNADGLEIEAQRVETTLEQYLPEANEIDLNIQRVNRQRELLTRSRTEVSARAQAADEDERRLRTAADRAARNLESAVSSMEEFRSQEVNVAFAEASAIISKAVSNARQARDSSRDSGAVTAGLAQQALAQLELRRAQMHLGVARAYASLAALGVGAKYSTLSDSALETAREAHEAAKAAFTAAASSLRSVRAQGDAGERLQASADLLDRYAQTELGSPPDLSAPPEPEAGFEDESFEDGAFDEESWEDGSVEEDSVEQSLIDDGFAEDELVDDLPVGEEGDGEEP